MAKQQYIRTEYSDGSVVLSNVRDSNTDETYSLKRVNTLPDGTLLNDTIVTELSPIYRKLGSEFFARTDFLKDRVINVKTFGAKGDGVTNDTEAINKALATGFDVNIPDGTYLVTPTKTVSGTSFGGGIIVNSNQTLTFSQNAVLTIPTQTTGKYVILNLRNTENAVVINPKIIGDVVTHEGILEEYGFGIYIASAKNFRVDNPVVSNCWGDGIIVTKDNVTLTPSFGGVINNPLLDSNRRQGMSIASWDGGVVNGGKYINTGQIKSINPSFGIDIEPDPDGRGLINIVINDPVTENNLRGGIQIVPAFMASPAYDGTGLFNIVINNHRSKGDQLFGGCRINYGAYGGTGSDESIPINGTIVYNNANIEDSQYNSISIDRFPETAPRVIINNPFIKNPNTAGLLSDSNLSSGITITQDVTQLTSANIEINNPTIIEDREVVTLYAPIKYTASSLSNIKNFVVKNLKSTGFTNIARSKVWVNKSLEYSVINDIEQINYVALPYSDFGQGAGMGETYIPENSGNFALPNPNTFTGYSVMFKYPVSDIGVVNIYPRGTEKFNIVGAALGERLVMSKYGDFVHVKANNGTWEVLDSGGSVRLFSRRIEDKLSGYTTISSAPSTPPIMDGEMYYDTVNKTWYKAYNTSAVSSWIPLNGQATELIRGQLEIATQAEVTAGTDDTRAITPLKLETKLKQGALITTSPTEVGVFTATTPEAYDVTYETDLRTALINTQNALNIVTLRLNEVTTKLNNIITKT